MYATAETIKVPLGRRDRTLAEEFARRQATPAQGKQVYLNLLAACAVRSYLQWMEVESHLAAAESDNLPLDLFGHTSELIIPEVGRLQCQFVIGDRSGDSSGDISVAINPSQALDLLGYMAVGLNEALTEAELLGFAPAEDKDELPLSSFLSLEALLESLEIFEDETARRVKAFLRYKSFSQVIAELEQIYRQHQDEPWQWRNKAGDVLEEDRELAGTRELKGELSALNYTELCDLAEDLMERLAEIWQ
ncbi:MAG: DUF1822 family protein [Oscillatoria sp. SIO1A7]|nr:DUF1822 family protein [Oscillatoria sp. SIO1A7]